MRIRPLAALSAIALSALVLAGCSGSGTPDASASGGGDALCNAAAPAGEASDSVTVDGEAGAVSTATFEPGLEVEELERTVVFEGDGDALADGDYVQYALSAFSADTGERLGDIGYAEAEILPSVVTSDSNFGQIMGCANIGSRLVLAFPATQSETGTPTAAEVYIVDVLGVTPTAAWGADQAPADGFPEVELAEDGAPAITLPDTDAPTTVDIEVLKLGDGATVEPGDTVLVQYTGVKWSDGTVFDSSWDRGAPAQFSTTGVVDGFRQALEGQTVGSQVLVVIPPEFGYGAVEGNELQEETLVFVVDILATQRAVG
ncbi:MAG TPA: peptidylprolyl isomerase [Microbacterium sp.]|nr:peptidylprolyl isomerase [Microbacterium sp.]